VYEAGDNRRRILPVNSYGTRNLNTKQHDIVSTQLVNTETKGNSIHRGDFNNY